MLRLPNNVEKDNQSGWVSWYDWCWEQRQQSTCCSSFQLLVLFYDVSLRCEFRVVISVMISAYKLCSIFTSSCLQEGACIIYVSCVCPTHIVLYYCFLFLPLVYPMLPVSLDCPFLIAPSVFSTVYLTTRLLMPLSSCIKLKKNC